MVGVITIGLSADGCIALFIRDIHIRGSDPCFQSVVVIKLMVFAILWQVGKGLDGRSSAAEGMRIAAYAHQLALAGADLTFIGGAVEGNGRIGRIHTRVQGPDFLHLIGGLLGVDKPPDGVGFTTI